MTDVPYDTTLLNYATATPDQKNKIMACRVWEKTNTRDSVFEILQAMQDWYNGYKFLWAKGGWKATNSIPEEYKESFRVETERKELLALMGLRHFSENVVIAACLMQAVRWFAGYDPEYNSRCRDGGRSLYYATAAVMAASLGYEVDSYLAGEDKWEGVIIRYNDMPGRTFDGVLDLIKSAKSMTFNSDGGMWNKNLAWALEQEGVVSEAQVAEDENLVDQLSEDI